MGDASGAAALIFSKNPPPRKMNIAHLCNQRNQRSLTFTRIEAAFLGHGERKFWPPFFLKRIANDTKNRDTF